jgi:hypothetical protein
MEAQMIQRVFFLMGKNDSKSPHYEKKKNEVAIFRQLVPTCHQNVGAILKAKFFYFPLGHVVKFD